MFHFHIWTCFKPFTLGVCFPGRTRSGGFCPGQVLPVLLLLFIVVPAAQWEVTGSLRFELNILVTSCFKPESKSFSLLRSVFESPSLTQCLSLSVSQWTDGPVDFGLSVDSGLSWLWPCGVLFPSVLKLRNVRPVGLTTTCVCVVL